MRHRGLEAKYFVEHFTSLTKKCPYETSERKKSFDSETVEDIKGLFDDKERVEKILDIIARSSNRYVRVDSKEEEEEHLDRVVASFSKLYREIKKTVQTREFKRVEFSALVDFDPDDMTEVISKVARIREGMVDDEDNNRKYFSNYDEIMEQVDEVLGMTMPLQAKRMSKYFRKDKVYEEELYSAKMGKRLSEVLSEIHPILVEGGYQAKSAYVSLEGSNFDSLTIAFSHYNQRDLDVKVEFEQRDWRAEDNGRDDRFTKVTMTYSSDKAEPELLITPILWPDDACYVNSLNFELNSRDLLRVRKMGAVDRSQRDLYYKNKIDNTSMVPSTAAQMRDKKIKTEYDHSHIDSHRTELEMFKNYMKLEKEAYVPLPTIIAGFVQRGRTMVKRQEDILKRTPKM